MKRYILILLTGLFLFSCSKTEMQETRSTIKSADSLLTTAREGLKTIDSLSVIIKDSQTFNKVVVPQIEKQKKAVERAIEGNSKSLDSLSRVLNQTAGTLRKGTDIIKIVDSARKGINENSSAVDILSTISKTLEKVSKQTEKSVTIQTDPSGTVVIESEEQTTGSAPSNSSTNNSIITSPKTSIAKVKVSVESLSEVKSEIQNGIHLYDARVESESFGEQGGEKQRVIWMHIPNRHYERALDYFANTGTLRTKSVESEGLDYDPNKTSELQLTLVETAPSAQWETTTPAVSNTDQTPTYKEQSKSAFNKGLENAKEASLALLPLWPFALVIAIVLFFMARRKKKKETALEEKVAFENPRNYSQAKEPQAYRETAKESPIARQEKPEEKKEPDTPEDPYEKYKPKF